MASRPDDDSFQSKASVPADRPGRLDDAPPPEPFNYRLRRFRWRTFLSIIGPLAVTAFYGLICFRYLAHPPKNGIAPHRILDARWVFYGWFIVVVLILDWARTGLANFEAAALMHPYLAPDSAMQLMWHTDSNWSNFLWWLRAIRNHALWLFPRRFSGPSSPYASSRPGWLWWFLSGITVLLFISIPLSGLTMELTDALVQSSAKAAILGPSPDTFNLRGPREISQRIRSNWRAGRPTTPPGKGIIYAPVTASDVSALYYEDKMNSASGDDVIQVFTGPTVDDVVYGDAWGLEAKIACRPVPKTELRLIAVADFDDYALLSWVDDDDQPTFRPRNELSYIANPVWISESGMHGTRTLYSLVAAADGSHGSVTPYGQLGNHDLNTLDSLTRPRNETTVAVFEAYLWQGYTANASDDTMTKLLGNDSTLFAKSTASASDYRPHLSPDIFPVVGFGVQCSVQSAVGNATIDPAHRTYSNFRQGTLAAWSGYLHGVFPLQVCALQSLGMLDPFGYNFSAYDTRFSDSTWLAAHQALGMLPYQKEVLDRPENVTPAHMLHKALEPQQLQTAMLKLLGEGLIVLMDRGGHAMWKDGLYGFERVKYLEPGIVPWQWAFGLLALWAFLTVAASTLMLSTKRWAPTLNGFEMFKFGARHFDEVNRFQGTQFRECDSLRTVPGMVGVISGKASASSYRLIGLSTYPADPQARYVLDNLEAGGPE